MSKYCILGRNGFIGSAIAARLGSEVASVPTPDTRVLFHFASHIHPAFEKNPGYEIKQTIDSFTQLLPYCFDHGIIFVWPSSALVYEKETEFSRFKLTLESLVKCYKTRTLGLRIFPAYGPGESRTVISQWCRQMAAHEAPTVYGDGEQSRDFIYIDDVVEQILGLVDDNRFVSRVVDIGTGERTTFNAIIDQINAELGESIKPKYVQRPYSYSDGVVCPAPLSTKIPIRQGIRNILASLKTEPMLVR